MKASRQLRKLRFDFDSQSWHGRASETVWVEKVANSRYRIRNSPFFAKGISFLDVVIAREDRNGDLVYESTSMSSGHSTYRIVPLKSGEEHLFAKYWGPLQKLGCTYESAMPEVNLVSVDIPPSANIREVFSLLEKGESAGAWEFEEGHCAKISQ